MPKIEVPSRLNNYPVVQSEVHPNCATVMMDKECGEYVVATWWPSLGTSWQWGHYLRGDSPEASGAKRRFVEVSIRNGGR